MRAVKVVRPMSPLDANAKGELAQTIGRLQPVGYTPIALALEVAGQELGRKDAQGGLVLISDGKDTCEGDPAAAAAKLARNPNLAFGVNVIGFDVRDDEQKAVEEIARAGKGKYYDAGNEVEFRNAVAALHKSLVKRPVRLVQTDPAIRVEKSPFTSITLSPLTLKGFPAITYACVNKAGSLVANVQSTNKPHRPMLVPAGMYDVYVNVVHGHTNDPIAANVEVKGGEKITLSLNQLAAVIQVEDPKLEGLAVESIWVVQAGKGGYLSARGGRVCKRFGESMLVRANTPYDVFIVPTEGQAVLLREKVTLKPGELLVLGGKTE